MRRILILVYTAFLIIMLTNYFYYKNLYNKQINYIVKLLDRQVQTVGLMVDSTNIWFSSDLNQISFKEDLSLFFTSPENQLRAKERMKLFFSKYNDFVTGIKFYDNNKNEFTLKKDNESNSGEWLEQPFILHAQAKMNDMEKLVQENQKFDYYLPVIKNNETIGNIVVTVDYQKYFYRIFSEFNLKDYQWQWVVTNSGEIIYDNSKNRTEYSQLDKITKSLAEGSVANIMHNATVNGKKIEIISSYYSTQILQRDMGLVFSSPITFFQKYLIWNSVFIVALTILLIQVIIYIFWRYLKSQKAEMEGLRTSEKMLFKLIEEMPVGVIVINKNREILKANKVCLLYTSDAADE